MTWIKICGITNIEDAQAAVDAGADALGFVFYERSPRSIDARSARDIIGQLPVGVEKIGVFVSEKHEQVDSIASHAGLTGVQTYDKAIWSRSHAPRPYKLISCLQASDLGSEIAAPSSFEGLYAVLLDSGSNDLPGGTGVPFDWKACEATATKIGRTQNLILAGGLTAENVADAIRILCPWGVDVSSGVEARPGKKDVKKIRAFITVVRQLEKI